MIKQIKSSEIKKFIDSNPNTVLLDVRTEMNGIQLVNLIQKILGIKILFYYNFTKNQVF